MSQAARDENFVTSTLLVGSTGDTFAWEGDETTGRAYVDIPGAGSGTVTSVSVVTANGFAGSVANATTTPAITLSTTVTGLIKGNGTAVSAAVANTDYQSPIALTTTGTSGAATFNGTTLNIPVYDINAASLVVGTTTISSGTTTRILYDNAGVLGEYTLTGSGTVVAMQTAPTFATSITTPSVLATANDSGALGAAATAFSDLFLASGAVIGFANGDYTLTHATGIITAAISNASTTPQFSYTQGSTGDAANCFALGSTISYAIGIDNSVAGDPFKISTAASASAVLGTGDLMTLTSAGAMTLASSATATAFIPSSSTIPTNGLYLPAANTLGWAINSAGEVQLTSTALSPIANDGNALGTSALGWADAFFATGAVLDFGNANSVITHSSGILTVSTGDLRVTTAGTNSASVMTNAGTQTVTNKRNQPRTASSTTASTLTPDLSSANVYYRTTQTATLTINAPTGTPVIGEVITIYVDSAGAQTLTIDSTYKVFGTAFPATTTAGKTFMLQAQYNGTDWKTTWANAV